MTQRRHARTFRTALIARASRASLGASIAVVATLFGATAASAQTAGTLLLRAGVTQIKPSVDSGDLTAPALVGSKADIRADTKLSGGLTYMVTDHVSIDLPLGVPFKHQIDGAGAIDGVGKIGEVRAVPMTLLAQYRFLEPGSVWRPYVGAGLTYAKFYKARGTAALTALSGGTPAAPTTLSVTSRFAATVQLGVSYRFDARWFVDATVLHSFLKTRTTLSTGQTLDATIDPTAVAVTLGYAF